MTDADSAAAEKPTPPVPPTDTERYDDPDLSRRVIERDEQAVPCPQCGGTLVLEDRQTGERVLAFWPDHLDDDQYRLTDDWPHVETVERCTDCAYRRQIA